MLFINYANYSDGSKELNLNFEDVYDKIITDYDTPCIPLSPHFWDYYEDLKILKNKIIQLTMTIAYNKKLTIFLSF